MGRWTQDVSILEAATIGTCTLLSMGSSIHADPEKRTSKKDYREWFATVLGEMEKALVDRESPFPDAEYDAWREIPNEPDLVVAPPHDELAPEPDPIPTEDHEQTFSLMAAFGDGSAF